MALDFKPETLTERLHRDLEREGYALVPDALGPRQLAEMREASERLRNERQREDPTNDAALHLFAFLPRDPSFAQLLDHPIALEVVARTLGYNIHMYHCHLDIRPPDDPREPRTWRWHQDGGRQNIEIETHPRPRLSVKVGYFLSDHLDEASGATRVLPGSHLSDSLDRPAVGATDFAEPGGAVPILGPAGTAFIFDRRLWHSRGPNTNGETRIAAFLTYTYRWIRPRDDDWIDPSWLSTLSPVQRQLMGASTSPMGHWIPEEEDVPLREWLEGP